MNRSEIVDVSVRPGGKTMSKASRLALLEYNQQKVQTSESWETPHNRPMREAVPSNEHPRSALKIRLEILETVRDEIPSKSSKIMRIANLSHERLVRYMEELVSLGLVNEKRDNGAKSYTLTSTGLEFVNQLREAETFVASFGLSI